MWAVTTRCHSLLGLPLLQTQQRLYQSLPVRSQGRTGPPGTYQVGPPARWAATSNVEGGSEAEEGAQGPLARREGWLSLDKLFTGVRVASYATARGVGLPN